MTFSNYNQQGPKAGKLVAHTLRGLRNPDGSSPILDLEHLGKENRAYWQELLTSAGTRAQTYGNTISELERADRDETAYRRDQLARHSARHLRNAFHEDGSPATDADIVGFIQALPDEDLQSLWIFANAPYPWREYPLGTAKPSEVAEK